MCMRIKPYHIRSTCCYVNDKKTSGGQTACMHFKPHYIQTFKNGTCSLFNFANHSVQPVLQAHPVYMREWVCGLSSLTANKNLFSCDCPICSNYFGGLSSCLYPVNGAIITDPDFVFVMYYVLLFYFSLWSLTALQVFALACPGFQMCVQSGKKTDALSLRV